MNGTPLYEVVYTGKKIKEYRIPNTDIKLDEEDILLLSKTDVTDLSAIIEGSTYTALHSAVINNRLNLIKYFLSRGADVNMKDDAHDWTALHWAAYYSRKDSHLNVCTFLLEHNADVDAQETDGNTPLNLLMIHNPRNDQLIKLFLKYKADPFKRNYNGAAAVHNAAKIANETLIEYLLGHPEHINIKNNENWTPLHYAVYYSENDSHLSVVQKLLEKNAGVNAEDSNRCIDLLKNGQNNNPGIRKLLKKYRAIYSMAENNKEKAFSDLSQAETSALRGETKETSDDLNQANENVLIKIIEDEEKFEKMKQELKESLHKTMRWYYCIPIFILAVFVLCLNFLILCT